MMEQIVLTLVSGVAVPILLEAWRSRQQRAQAAPAGAAALPAAAEPVPAAAAPAPASGLPPLLRSVLRLLLAAVVGTLTALVVSVAIGPDTTDFTTLDGVLSFIFVLLFWYLLGKAGPLAHRN